MEVSLKLWRSFLGFPVHVSSLCVDSVEPVFDGTCSDGIQILALVAFFGNLSHWHPLVYIECYIESHRITCFSIMYYDGTRSL